MEFEWDSNKNRVIRACRDFDFTYATRVFADPQRIVEPDDRFHYSEQRYRVYGMIEGRVYVIVYTLRGSIHRIITAWKANEREIRYYVYNSNQG